MSMQLPLFNQRWRLRRDSYRPAGEPINPSLYEVTELGGDRESKAFILAHHYSACPSPPWRLSLRWLQAARYTTSPALRYNDGS
jgi:hypothetical protein